MSVRNLGKLFAPRSVALVGASNRPGSLGATLLHNLVAGGFGGAIYPVNPKHTELAGLPVAASVADLPAAPDLAVICTPPATVPGIIRQLGGCTFMANAALGEDDGTIGNRQCCLDVLFDENDGHASRVDRLQHLENLADDLR